MGNLLLILLVLFAALAVVVKLTEKHGKPLEPEQQSKLWMMITVLIVILLAARLLEMVI